MSTEVHAGILKAWDGANWQATVQLTGSLTSWLRKVPTSRAIPGAEMVVGRRVANHGHQGRRRDQETNTTSHQRISRKVRLQREEGHNLPDFATHGHVKAGFRSPPLPKSTGLQVGLCSGWLQCAAR